MGSEVDGARSVRSLPGDTWVLGRVRVLSSFAMHFVDVYVNSHYFYVLRGEYIVPDTPKASWFSRPSKHEDTQRGASSPMTPYPGKKARKRMKAIVLTELMVIDVDPKKASLS